MTTTDAMTSAMSGPPGHTSRPAWVLLVTWTVLTLGWWAFAFMAVPTEAPEWLARAQMACFGTSPSGLPGGYGWMLLIGGPLSFAIGGIVAWGEELAILWQDIRKKGFAKAAALVLLAALAAEAHWVGTRIQTGLRIENVSFAPNVSGPLPDSYPQMARTAPPFRLTDQSGKPVELSTFHGKAVILTFAFAHCQAVCPTLVHTTTEALKTMDSTKVSAVLITLDPWRDTVQALPGLAEKWELPANAHILSGSVPEVTSTLDRFEVPWKRNEKTGEVDHPALVYVLDPRGRISYAFNNPTAQWLSDAVQRLTQP